MAGVLPSPSLTVRARVFLVGTFVTINMRGLGLAALAANGGAALLGVLRVPDFDAFLQVC